MWRRNLKNQPHIHLLIALTASLLLALACTRSDFGRKDPDLRSLPFEGRERTYRLLVPSGYDPRNPTPLVLALHGGGGDSRQMCSLPGGVQEHAEARRLLVACPDAVEHHWNDGRGNPRYRAQAEHIDDVGFLLALIDRLGTQYRLDLDRVYITGASNGGMMTLRMACQAADRFAAAAVVIASLPTALDCQPSEPIPILFMNGTEDPLMPYGGGQVHFFRQELGAVLSTPETAAFWAAANGCDPLPEDELLADLDPADGTRIRLSTYSGCDRGARVLLYSVEGGGHTWPGGSQYVPRFVIGRVSRDLDSGEAIVGFFESVSRP